MTPPPMSVSDYQQQMAAPYSNGVWMWRVIAAAGWGLVPGLVTALVGAYLHKGVPQEDLDKAKAEFREELHQYVKEYSPYVFDKQGLADRNKEQDEKIGYLTGRQERVFERLNGLDTYNTIDMREKQEIQTKLKLLGDTLDALRKEKK